jgi:hypothetical protein
VLPGCFARGWARRNADWIPINIWPRAVVSLVLLWSAVACAVNNPTPRADGVIVEDDFSDPASGWNRHTSADITTDYGDGHYRVLVGAPNHDAWGLAGLDLNDLRIEADTQSAAGPLDNSFGVLCRFTRSDDRSNFYFFFISSDGYYAMGKVARNERTYLNPNGNFEPLAAIRTEPGAINRLSAACAKDQFTFTVNGQPAGSFSDGEFTHGDAGLIASTLNQGGVEIRFDNVVIRQP